MLRSAEQHPHHGGKTINPALITTINPALNTIIQRAAPSAEDTDSESSSLTSDDEAEKDKGKTTAQTKTHLDDESQPREDDKKRKCLNQTRVFLAGAI